MKNLGQYEKIYPLILDTEEAQAQNQVYESIRTHAYEIWYSQTGAKKKDGQVALKKEEIAKKPPIKRATSMRKEIG